METEQLIKEKDRAWRAWQQAINHFNNVTGKEDIDLAVFDMETKKRQYMRLTEEIKREKTAVAQEQETVERVPDFGDVPEKRGGVRAETPRREKASGVQEQEAVERVPDFGDVPEKRSGAREILLKFFPFVRKR